MRGRVSVIIPSRNERFLAPTVKDVLEKAGGDIEVIVTLDGYWSDPPLPDDPRLILVHRGKPRGMRPGINAAVAVSRGEYIFKLDGHCLLDQGFDMKLKAECDRDWVAVPRRYALDAETWSRKRGRHPVDYMFLSYPNLQGEPVAPGMERMVSNPGDRGGNGLHGRSWEEKNRDPALKARTIDDLMSAQGSAYFLHRAYFDDLELLDVAHYGTFGHEFQEVGLKAWLGGGRVIRNKSTWYAHLHKGQKWGRGYRLGRSDGDKATAYTNRWLTDSAWEKQTRPFKWLIHHFWPVPGWPEEWAP